MNIILASGSPRRKEILKQLGIDFKTIKSNYHEPAHEHLTPEELAKSHSRHKTLWVAKNIKEPSIILGFDTFVIHNNKIIGKPKDKTDAINILSALSDTTHKVITGCYFMNTERKRFRSFTDTTKIQFRKLKKSEIKKYVENEKPFDKAGAYAIQDSAYGFVKNIEGDYYNVVGLPVLKFVKEFTKFV